MPGSSCMWPRSSRTPQQCAGRCGSCEGCEGGCACTGSGRGCVAGSGGTAGGCEVSMLPRYVWATVWVVLWCSLGMTVNDGAAAAAGAGAAAAGAADAAGRKRVRLSPCVNHEDEEWCVKAAKECVSSDDEGWCLPKRRTRFCSRRLALPEEDVCQQCFPPPSDTEDEVNESRWPYCRGSGSRPQDQPLCKRCRAHIPKNMWNTYSEFKEVWGDLQSDFAAREFHKPKKGKSRQGRQKKAKAAAAAAAAEATRPAVSAAGKPSDAA